MKAFQRLVVWEKSHQFVLEVYRLSQKFPANEQFSLTGQIRRSAISIPANISEGCGRNSDPDFARFLQIAFGSACETEYYLILARDLEFLSKPSFDDLQQKIAEIKRMLAVFIKKLRA